MTPRDVEDVQLLVVGGGKAGKSLAMDRAKAGWSVAMVERDKIGGTCINVACIPTKALVGSARTLLTARHAAVMGVAARRRARGLAGRGCGATRSPSSTGWSSAHEKMFAESGMDFILGTARFVGAAHRRDPDQRRRHPADPRPRRRDQHRHHPGAAGPARHRRGGRVDLGDDPAARAAPARRCSILGGGYVGCEFASMFAIFGTRVTLVQGPDQAAAPRGPRRRRRGGRHPHRPGRRRAPGCARPAVHREPGPRDGRRHTRRRIEVRGRGAARWPPAATPVTAELGLEPAGVDSPTGASSRWTTTCAPAPSTVWAAGRRGRQPPVHPRLLERLPDPHGQPDRWRRRHHRPARPLHRVHHPGAGPGRA